MKLLTETYQSLISCELSCYDRLILTGTLPEISYGQGITSYLNSHGTRIFDYAQFADTRIQKANFSNSVCGI